MCVGMLQIFESSNDFQLFRQKDLRRIRSEGNDYQPEIVHYHTGKTTCNCKFHQMWVGIYEWPTLSLVNDNITITNITIHNHVLNNHVCKE